MNIKTTQAIVPETSGRNTPNLLLWRPEDDTLRVACHLGEFSVWREGPQERELFRINLGILAEINRRAKRLTQARQNALPELRALTPAEIQSAWRACAADPEVRFSASIHATPDRLGGWRACLKAVERLLQMQNKPVPWSPTF